ncbi:hypothetical protein CDL15_Pgr013955 [Punica granatum]|uniref:TIR domain-containing protein n=1 Tax=Punica granatum TaxID=22663 RepID=A0A218W9G2_PUNGR|nr:hypothetical protein CDL15_Pgr013955 [Punica granatum]
MASSSNSLPTSPATTCVEYDVFLNFRGPDTRPNFTDCLYTALTGARISVFRDTEELTVGENINSEILEKIRRSTISIPIFSENYASSKSCLMEVAEMAECRRRAGQVIMPIFYDVPPWVVRHQGGTFERDFREHERKGIDPETIHTWKQALSDVGDLKGWELAKIDNGHYSKVIQLVVSHVEIVLKKVQLVIPEYLVGINDHAKHLMRELDMASTDVRIIVIHGIAGIGKTTLAKFILLLLSLVKIGDSGELWMHDQLRDLGREIVRRENPERPRKRSRLWDHTDAFRTLKKMKRSNKVVGLSLTFEDDLDNCFTGMEFSCLPNLRFLRLDQAATEERFEHRLSSLRWLDWEGCSKIDDVLDMHLENLVVLDLSSSKVNQDRDSWSKLMKMAKELKVLNLQGCANLRGSPSFPTEMTLKILILEGCYRLMRVDPSISNLKGLKSLNLKFCIEVKQLPEGLCFMKELKELLLDGTSIRRIHFPKGSMEQLEVLSACGCKNLTLITDSIGNLKSLTHLALDDAIIGKLPSSIGSLERLQRLSLRNCYNILQLPPSVGDLKSLMEIDLSNTKIAELPPSFNNLKNLKVLKMEGCFLREFPGALSHLSKMEEIDFSLCRSLSGDISIDITALPVLRILRLSHTEISSLTATIAGLSDLEVLDLLECKKLQMLPMLPSSLSSLRVGSEMLREVPDLSTLTNLKELHLQFDPAVASCEVLNTFGWILSLSKLETLEVYLSNLTELRLPPGFVSLSQLRKLTFSRVDLQYLLYFPSSLSTLSLQHCRSLTKAPDFSNLNGFSELELLHCKMAEIHGLEHLKALQDLKLSHCCVKGLGGLNRLSNLRNLTLFNCEFLEILPDISHLKMLREPEIEFCRFACDDKDPRHYAGLRTESAIADPFLDSLCNLRHAEDSGKQSLLN